jgi:hypothetical protein
MCPEPEDNLSPTVAVAATVAANHSKESDIGKLESYKLIDLKSGGPASNPYIRPGDIVIVTEGEPIFVTGAVFGPRELVLKEQMTLRQAIAMSGGPQKLANTAQVHIYRKKDGKIGSEDLKFDYDAIRKGKADDVLLKPYDIVDVRPMGTFAPKSLAEILKGIGTGTLGTLPLRMPIP